MSGDNDSSPINPQDQNSDVFALLEDKDRYAVWDRLAAKAAKQQAREPTKLNDFDRNFFAQVEPKLTGYVRLGAYMVRLEIETFTDAHNRVMRAARKHGAAHLSDEAFFQLDSWIDRALLATIDEPPPEGLVTPEQLARIRRECR